MAETGTCEIGTWTSPSGLRLDWAAASHIGKVRKVNEDSLLARPGAFVVADGMGGHRAGDVASRLAIGAVESALDSGPISVDMLPGLVRAANEVVRAEARASDRAGMGSTLVGLFVVDNGGDEELAVVNVGDSRCYRVEDGRLSQITRDHSHVQDLVEAGVITADQAHAHPERNVITRAIGVESVVAGDYYFLPRLAQSRLLLCSDGLLGDVDDDRIERILVDAETPGSAADSLLSEALTGKAADNITLVVVDAMLADDSDADAGAASPGVSQRGIERSDSDITLPHHHVVAVQAAEHVQEVGHEVASTGDAPIPGAASAQVEVIDAVPLPDDVAVEEAVEQAATLIDEVPKESDDD